MLDVEIFGWFEYMWSWLIVQKWIQFTGTWVQLMKNRSKDMSSLSCYTYVLLSVHFLCWLGVWPGLYRNMNFDPRMIPYMWLFYGMWCSEIQLYKKVWAPLVIFVVFLWFGFPLVVRNHNFRFIYYIAHKQWYLRSEMNE